MTPIQALSEVCREFCGIRPGAARTDSVHDDACLQLREIVREWVTLRAGGDHCPRCDPSSCICTCHDEERKP